MVSVLWGRDAPLHDPGAGHPESKARVEQLHRSLTGAGFPLRSCAREATREELATVHDLSYVDRVLALDGQEADLDPETHLGRDSVRAARNAAGTALTLADEILAQGDRLFAVVRPPGHHAHAGKTSGYCVFNNVALAAEHLRRRGLRVCILDWDVHHGDGTEQIFLAQPEVLFVSVHSDHLFPPNTGSVTVMGEGAGRGANVNIPLPAGAALPAYALAIQAVILPLVRRFAPDVVLVSLGFDACRGDPQGNLLLRPKDFEFIGAATMEAAAGSARGRLGLLLEGGYNTSTIGPCALAALAGLDRKTDEWSPDPPSASERTSIESAARIHGLRLG
jgi:acetoin utilization deacetylase AcuC-like enzyme